MGKHQTSQGCSGRQARQGVHQGRQGNHHRRQERWGPCRQCPSSFRHCCRQGREPAIRKGTGQDAGGDITEITYEGYGAGGVAIIVETATDNKNRTVAEVRHVFTKYGGTMGESGSVAFQFDRMGVITLDKEKYADEEAVMNMVLEAGADDVQDNEDTWEVRTSMADFNSVRETLEGQGVEMMEDQLAMVPRVLVPIDADTAQKLVRITDALEDLDDVQNVYTNADFPEDFDPEA